MWTLERDAKKADAYLQLMKIKLSAKLKAYKKKNDSGNIKISQFLHEDIFWEYLIAEPRRLLEMHNKLFSYVKNDSDRNYIKNMFNYQSYIQKDKSVSYEVAKIMSVNTCTYCNRQYILTIEDKNDKTIRAEFDHWFSQNLYPDLALSYYNLIPACKNCNSSIKHDKIMSFNQYIHPYLDEKPGFDFRYIPKSHGYSVDVQIDENLSNEYKQKVKETLRLFKIQEIYNAHSDFELKNLMELSHDYPGDYIETLTSTVMKDLNVSEEDVYRMLFGIESEIMKHHIRPFSKFKTDIIKQIRAERKN